MENGKQKLWRTKEGNLVPIEKLQNGQLINARNVALKLNKKHFDLFNKFTDLLDELDKEMEKRERKSSNIAAKLKNELKK